jgi:hypothetical protein
MAWQDDLNSLDRALSAGKIDTEEYRRRRDELLAAASSNPGVVRRNQRQQQPSIANAFIGDTAATTPDAPKPVGAQQQQWQAARPAPPPPVSAIEQPSRAPMLGAEVFTPPAPRAPDRPKWPRFVIAVLVLALVTAGTWWFAFREDGEPSAAGGQDGAPQPPAQLSIDKIPNPTDEPMTYSGVFTLDQAQVHNLLQPDEAATLVEGGSKKVYFRGISSGNLVYHIFAYETATADAARKLANSVIERDKRAGMIEETISDLPRGVRVVKSIGEESAIFEAVYPTNQAAVRILVVQKGATNERQLGDAAKRGVTAATRSLPIG